MRRAARRRQAAIAVLAAVLGVISTVNVVAGAVLRDLDAALIGLLGLLLAGAALLGRTQSILLRQALTGWREALAREDELRARLERAAPEVRVWDL